MESIISTEVTHGPVYDFAGLGFSPRDVVIITGAGSGIGRASALTASKAGLHVAAWDRDIGAARETQRLIEAEGGTALAIGADVTDQGAIDRALDSSIAMGPCCYLVNNAGPAASSQGSFDDNLLAAVGSVHHVTTKWIERAGDTAKSLVNMSSVSGTFQGGTMQPFYPTSKAAIAAYTRNLAVRYGGKPRANAIAPGFTLTPRTIPYLDQPDMRTRVSRIPAGRLGCPEEIASAVCFLLSPAASYINGVLLPVDGGWVLT